MFRKHPSKLATLMVTFGAGGRVEWNSKYPMGIAHFMEHMRFKGTDTKTATDLLKETANAGGSWNAWTSEDLVSYYMTIPEENIETAFRCLSDIVLRPSFPQKELIKEQEVVCQEVRMYLDDIDHLVHCKMMDAAFDNALTLPVVGREESVMAINRQYILDFNKEFYSPEHMLITLGANNSHDHLVDKYFGAPNDILLFPPGAEKVNYKNSAGHTVHKEGQLQHSIFIAFGSEDMRSAIIKERAKIKVFSSIFGQSDTSRLFLKVREDLGLVYGIGASCMHNMDGTLFAIYTATEPENSEKVITAIDGEITKITEELPSQEEIDRAKNVIRSSYYKMMDSSDSSLYSILNQEFFGYAIDSKFLAEIDEVTREDINEVAKKMFAGNRYQVIGMG